MRVQEEKDETHRSSWRSRWSVGTRVGHLEETRSMGPTKVGGQEDEAWNSRQKEEDEAQRSNCGVKARRIQEEEASEYDYKDDEA